MDDDLYRLIVQKNEALLKSRRTKRRVDKANAGRLRNYVNGLNRDAKRDYVAKLSAENKGDSRSYWQSINLILNNKGGTCTKFNLKNDDGNVIESVKTADFINNYFINIGPNLAKDMKEEWTYDGPVAETELLTCRVEKADIEKLIKDIDVTKASSMENMKSNIVKDALSVVPEKVLDLFVCSLNSGIIPLEWKLATVIPLQKEGDKSQVSNLRPVSLLNMVVKLMEKVVHKNVTEYLESNKLLDKNQGGFRSGHSTTDTTANLVDQIARGMNSRHFTIATYLDLKKAFDTVNHVILLKKLKLLGIKGKIYDWIKNYLQDRTQKTLANNINSGIQKITCGLPQGSIMGPLLFLIYINDISNILLKTKCFLYADDTVLYSINSDLAQATQDMEEDLGRIALWLKRNKLTLNKKKTKYMIYGMRAQLKKIQYHRLMIGDEIIEKVQSFKYLGMILDPVLSFNKHIDSIRSIYAHKLLLYNKICFYLDTPKMLDLYKSHVLPYVDYGDVLYAGANKGKLDKLQRLQNQALRVALNVNMRFPVILLHQQAKISNLEVRRQAHLRNFMFKQKSNVDLINSRNVRTRAHDAILYKTLIPKNEKYRSSVLYRGAMCWNNLKVEERNIVEFDKFKLHNKKWMSKMNYI